MLGMLVAPQVAAAQYGPALSISQDNVNLFGSSGGIPITYGWQFRTNIDITVDKLGFYNGYNYPPRLFEPHDVGIYDSAGNLIVSATIPAGANAELFHNFWYVSITPTLLSANHVYTAAAYLPSPKQDSLFYAQVWNSQYSNPVSFNSAIAWLQGVHDLGAAGLRFPTSACCGSSGIIGFFGPSFNIRQPNSPPVITNLSGPTSPVELNYAAYISANFTDANTYDTHTCTLSWGDGVTTPGEVTEPTASSAGECHAIYFYGAAGVYPVGITVADNQGASASATFQYIVVYDPAGGFVTGSGWINSPAGAYVPNATLTGKATFGFISKYERGATTPAGQTEFDFNITNLNFRSNVYEWLVVSGPKAQYKGTGTINGTGDYGFLLTATDGVLPGGGGVDRFRIKIWDKVTDSLVYDNVGGSDDINSTNPQVISGGSIVIHTR